MHILLVTPAKPGSRAGNRATAERWQGLLSDAGHRVDVTTDYQGGRCDVLIALHAWRSRGAIRQFRTRYPDKPLIVVLTGTDIYHHQVAFPDDTLGSMELADVLIGLHDKVANDIPPRFREKLVCLYQSAATPKIAPEPSTKVFQVCVIGHLRHEKDSLRAAYAARLLPESSQVRVINAGKAHDEAWALLAREESSTNARFEWVGELDQKATQNLMLSSQAMVISSVMEGGANVVSEACRNGIPIIASDISGNRGLLGDDYPGYFPAKNEAALAEMLARLETQPEFVELLKSRIHKLAERFTPEKERASLLQAIERAQSTSVMGSMGPSSS